LTNQLSKTTLYTVEQEFIDSSATFITPYRYQPKYWLAMLLHNRTNELEAKRKSHNLVVSCLISCVRALLSTFVSDLAQ